MSERLLEMRNIRKSFGATRALSGVSVDLHSGEVHALLGENGAGKSTLINILGGIVQPDSGSIVINGEVVGSFQDVQAARRYGIAVIHQEIVLNHLSVAENIYLGREPTTGIGLKDSKAIYKQAREIIDSLDLDLDVGRPVRELSTAQQQMVEIVKAISFNARIVVMDEPTSSLSLPEVARLFEIIRRLKENGVGIIYISHRLDEIFEISERVTVIRDGAYIGTKLTADTDHQELVKMMVGEACLPSTTGVFAPELKRFFQWMGSRSAACSRMSPFPFARGRSWGSQAWSGPAEARLWRRFSGRTISIAARSGLTAGTSDSEIRKRLSCGLAMVPEDRKTTVFVMSNSVGFNLTLAALRSLAPGPLVSSRKRNQIIDRLISQLNIKTSSAWTAVSSLSGGNE